MREKKPAKKVEKPAQKIIENDAGVIDLPYLILTLILLAVGLVMLFSASFPSSYKKEEGNAAAIVLKQLIVAGIGLVAMYALSRIPHIIFFKLSKLIYIVSVGLLAGVLLYGMVGGGARRWLDLGFTQFQPSEVVKVALVFSMASILVRRQNRIKDIKTFYECAGGLGIVAVFMVLQPHYSATIIMAAMCFVMMLCGGISKKLLFSIFGFAAAALLCFLLFGGSYAERRIEGWLDPFDDAAGKGYQIVQSLYSIGSGGWLGLGFGMSRQKYEYLPEEHNDYIFSIVCEELGYIGVLLIMLLFLLLVLRGFWIAIHCRNRFSMLVAIGLTTLLGLQVLLNIAVVTNSLPSTGISLPFFSYGGTALIVQLGEAGIMLNISRSIVQSQV